jgi:hypothetical protein
VRAARRAEDVAEEDSQSLVVDVGMAIVRTDELRGAFGGRPLPAAAHNDGDGGVGAQMHQLAGDAGGHEADDLLIGERVRQHAGVHDGGLGGVVGTERNDDAQAVVEGNEGGERRQVGSSHNYFLAMRVGAYPGTFDPPTIAHLAIAETALRQCRLDALDLVVNAQPLAKGTVRPLATRVELLVGLARRRPWLRVVVTENRHLADIAEGYDVLVLGADKWAQVLDAGFYGSEDERDHAVSRLPDLAVAPRDGLAMPPQCVVLEIDDHLASVSSTAARAGRLDVVPPEIRPLL